MKIQLFKAAIVVSQMSLLLLAGAGCESALVPVEPPAHIDNTGGSSAYVYYAPAKVDVLPLTEFAPPGDNTQGPKLKVYVSLLDPFGSQIKAPAAFRFELYQRLARSAKPKGKRIVIWPDLDLTAPAKNNHHWRDFLRAYEFELAFESKTNQSYILQTTCLCPNGKRLLAEFDLKPYKPAMRK